MGKPDVMLMTLQNLVEWTRRGNIKWPSTVENLDENPTPTSVRLLLFLGASKEVVRTMAAEIRYQFLLTNHGDVLKALSGPHGLAYMRVLLIKHEQKEAADGEKELSA